MKIEKKKNRGKMTSTTVGALSLILMSSPNVNAVNFARIKSRTYIPIEISPVLQNTPTSQINTDSYASFKRFPIKLVPTNNTPAELWQLKSDIFFLKNFLRDILDPQRKPTVQQVDKDSYSIQNRNNIELIFQLSNDQKNWETFTIPSGEAREFKVYRFRFIKIYTTDYNYVTYELRALKRYEIKWNSSTNRWDIFRIAR